MTTGVVDFLGVFGSDERFLVFALSSLVLTLSLIPLMRNAHGGVRLLMGSGAFLIVFAFVVLAPMSSLNWLPAQSDINPVGLNFNFGFLALGLGLVFKFRNLPTTRRK